MLFLCRKEKVLEESKKRLAEKAIKVLGQREFDCFIKRVVEHYTIAQVARSFRLTWDEADELLEGALQKMREEVLEEMLIQKIQDEKQKQEVCA